MLYLDNVPYSHSIDKNAGLFQVKFSYCPMVWMFHSRTINAKINSLHYRAWRIVYQDEISTFKELLKKDGSITIHHQNLHLLAIEMFNVVNGLAPLFMANIFANNLTNLNTGNVSTNIQSQSTFYKPGNPKTVN